MSRERDRDRRDDSLYRDDRRDREGRRNYDRRHGDDRRSRGHDGRGSYSQRFPFIAADQRPPVYVLTNEAYMHMLPHVLPDDLKNEIATAAVAADTKLVFPQEAQRHARQTRDRGSAS